MGVSVTDDWADYLASGGVGLVSTSTGGTMNLFSGRLLDQPDDAMAVRPTGGLPSEHAMSTGPGRALAIRPRIQVLIRARAYPDAESKARDVLRLADGLAERTINGTRYLYATAVQPPIALGQDDNGRSMFSINLDVLREV